MYPITSGRDEDEQVDDQHDDEVDDADYETEEAPLTGFGLKTTILFRSIFVGIGIGGALALLLAVMQSLLMGRGAARFGGNFIEPPTFFTSFFSNLAWCAPVIFLGSIILGSLEVLLQWNYETTRKATRAMIRAIRQRKRARKTARQNRNSREKSAQKIVEPMVNDLNLEIDNEDD